MTSQPPAQLSASRRAALVHAQSRGRLSSAAAAVFDRTGVHWSEAVGENTDTGAQYRIGSITKTFTAVLVMQAVHDGLIGLDTPVGEVLGAASGGVPNHAMVGHGYRDATVSHLLAHTAGLQSEPVGDWWERSPGVDAATLLQRNDGSGRVAAAGAFHHYSNLGYALLGLVTEACHGASWWSLVSERLLTPLQLTRTSYHPDARAESGWSIDHFTEMRMREPAVDTVAMAPAGQLWSTVGDLALWGSFLVGGHPDVLDAATLAGMRTHVAPGQGLGLQMVGPHERHLIGHGGSMPGFLAALFVDPVTGEGASFLCNATTGVVQGDVAQQLLGRLPVPPAPVGEWQATESLPAAVRGVPGLWFWGNSATEFRWHRGGLDLHASAIGRHTDRFELDGERLVGVFGYHRGEELQVTRSPDGTVVALECATFGWTRTPYDR